MLVERIKLDGKYEIGRKRRITNTCYKIVCYIRKSIIKKYLRFSSINIDPDAIIRINNYILLAQRFRVYDNAKEMEANRKTNEIIINIMIIIFSLNKSHVFYLSLDALSQDKRRT